MYRAWRTPGEQWNCWVIPYRYDPLIFGDDIYTIVSFFQLYTLQGRLRECLQHYYKLRGLQNKSQVAQFKVNSKHNNDKLFQLKKELSDVVTHINNFLKNTSESHQTISLKDYKETPIQTPVRWLTVALQFAIFYSPPFCQFQWLKSGQY